MYPDESQRVLIARQRRRSSVRSAAVAFAVVGVVTAMVLVFDPPARRVENAGQEGVRVAALFVAALMMYTYLFLVWRKGYWHSWRESPLWALPASRRRRLRTRIRRNAPPGKAVSGSRCRAG